MRIIDKESISGKVLRSIAIGAGILVVMSNKRASYQLTKALVKEILGKRKDLNLNREIYRLRKQKLIDIKNTDHGEKIVLTEEGKKIILRFDYQNLKLKKKIVWDYKWRMILFDIPNTKKSKRDIFREKVKEMGCVRFNDSVWIYPFPCQKEIDFVANYWNIGKYIHFAVISKITNEEILKKHFNL